MSFYLKDPLSRVDYAIDWASQLDGAAIEASAWSIAPAEAGGIAVEQHSFSGARAGARFAGGVTGHSYRLNNMIALSDGRAESRSLTIRVEEG
ncbi:MAG TPA: hypothetical protein VJS15_01250 [Allosphingosinicella sp.]|nr:hypothetical protein [Allosphingosinicella sp.]